IDTNKFCERLRYAWVELIVYTGYAKYLRVLIRKPTLLFFTLWGICLLCPYRIIVRTTKA
ncbi:hypothetical protein PL669_22900, partial [Phocaeicola vulgatus]|nr:hypothetical protein [Phocaeicola vulgatus]